jgi:hypothetical protein
MVQPKNVVFQGMKARKSVIRFVQKRLEKLRTGAEGAFDYFVRIERRREACIECSVVVRRQGSEWRVQEWGHSLPEALSRALKHLKPSLQPLLVGT